MTQTFQNELGNYLARARKDRGLSLRAVESDTRISNAYLSQLETGKIKTPSPTVLHSLALRYDISYGHLMNLAGYPIPDQSDTIASNRMTELAARLGDVSSDEEEAIVQFLNLIRKRERGAS